MSSTYTKEDKKLAELIEHAYKDVGSRPRSFKILGKEHKYMQELSSDLYAHYEDDTTILLGIHGASNFELTLDAVKSFLEPDKELDSIKRFCDKHLELRKSKKEVFMVGHSLGALMIADCEVSNPNNKIFGLVFGPYFPSKEDPRAVFMASSSKFISGCNPVNKSSQLTSLYVFLSNPVSCIPP